ncbi:hypothetical protein [Pontibacter harenae]|uniref:hypothetical protein n=1 Tax=Pontibacter harenae TaxID=2894083 RepID=UPI001E3BB5CA|nr:hypothetical protein [Pontibacter harenae]MCC9168917.1 hypothetical protein [Pontibacter harenae]
MGNKDNKSFENVLGKLHGNKVSKPTPNENTHHESVAAPSKYKKVSNRKRITFFVNEVLEDYIDKGTLHEMYRSKSDFVEHILMDYFKNKAYIKK